MDLLGSTDKDRIFFSLINASELLGVTLPSHALQQLFYPYISLHLGSQFFTSIPLEKAFILPS